jgi:hypothetical protein
MVSMTDYYLLFGSKGIRKYWIMRLKYAWYKDKLLINAHE